MGCVSCHRISKVTERTMAGSGATAARRRGRGRGRGGKGRGEQLQSRGAGRRKQRLAIDCAWRSMKCVMRSQELLAASMPYAKARE